MISNGVATVGVNKGLKSTQ